MLKVRNLTIFDHAEPLLVNSNLSVKRGEVIGVIGPNGSGKTALLKAMAGGCEKYEGEIKVNDFDMDTDPLRAKMHLGYLPSNLALEPYLTGLEWLEVVGSLYHIAPKNRIERILELAERFDCKNFIYTIIEQLGQAEKQKIALIASILHKPDFILWDEPLNYLDPSSQNDVSAFIKEASGDRTSFVIASNNLPWIEEVAERIVILKEGDLVAEGTLSELGNQFRPQKKDLASIYAAATNG